VKAEEWAMAGLQTLRWQWIHNVKSNERCTAWGIEGGYTGPYGKGYPRRKKTAAGRQPCGRATPQMAVRPFGGVACPQGVKGLGMAGRGENLGSPWIPLPVRA
jgi:hypothetical protein